MHALLQRRGGDLGGGQADPFVDDVHARVSRAHRDLLGAVGVPVEAGLADEDLRPAAEPLLQARDLLAQLAQIRVRRFVPAGLADAGGGAVGAEHLAQRARPLARRGAGARGGDRRDHQVLLRALLGGDPRELGEGRVDGPLVALGAPAAHGLDLLGLDRGVDDQDAALGVVGQRRDGRLGEAVLADDDLLAGLDPVDPPAVGVDQGALHVGDRLDRAAVLGDDGDLGAGAVEQFGDEAVHHVRALEDVGVLQEVGLVGHHLLDPQRPLLIPGAGQAERLVPGRQLDRARAGVAPERDGERLEHDPLDVVLRLGLGQA